MKKDRREIINIRQQESVAAKNKIIELITSRRYDDALEELEEWAHHAKRWSPEDMMVFYWPQFAYCYFKTDNFYKARQTLNYILEENPEDGLSHNLLGYIFLCDGRESQAIYHFTEMLKIPGHSRRAKKILNFISETDSPDQLLSKKTGFYYRHPPEMIFPTLGEPLAWLGYQWKHFRKKPMKILAVILLLMVLVAIVVGVGWLVRYNAQGGGKTPIQLEVEKGSAWGQLYQRMESSIKFRDFNTATIAYNQARMKGIPPHLAEYFKYLSQFIVSPDLETLPVTETFTHLRRDSALYYNTFVRLRGKLNLLRNNSANGSVEYLFQAGRPINETVYLTFPPGTGNKVKVDLRQNYEVMARFEQVEGSKVFLQGVQLRSLVQQTTPAK